VIGRQRRGAGSLHPANSDRTPGDRETRPQVSPAESPGLTLLAAAAADGHPIATSASDDNWPLMIRFEALCPARHSRW
jgi:hypothetical protein